MLLVVALVLKLGLPLMALALADDAAARGYAPGRWAMLHFGDDGGSRSAIYAAAS